MSTKRTLSTICLSLSAAAAVAACGTESAYDDVETTESSVQALTASTMGVKWLGDLHLKNATGVCAEESGAVLTTRPCANKGKQLFSILQMPDGNFELCKPGTIRTYSLLEGGGGYVPPAEVVGYQGTCLHGGDGANSKGEDLRFRKIRLTESWKFAGSPDEEAFHRVNPGVIQYHGDGTLRYLRARPGNIGVNSGGVVVIGKLTANQNQKWSIY